MSEALFKHYAHNFVTQINSDFCVKSHLNFLDRDVSHGFKC